MKIQKTIKWAAAIAAVCLAAYSASATCIVSTNGNMVGVNFVANDNPANAETGDAIPGGVQNGFVDSLATNEVTGVFPQPHWNNLGRYGDNVSLMDSNGCDSGISISWYSWGMWHSASYTGFGGDTTAIYPQPPNTPNLKLMDGYLESGWNQHSIAPVLLNQPIPPGTVLTNSTMGVLSAPIILLKGIDTFLLAQGGGTYSIVIYTGTGNAPTESRHSEIWLEKVTLNSSPPDAITEGATNSTQYYCLYNTMFDGSSFTTPPATATNNQQAADFNCVVFDGLTDDQVLIRGQDISGGPGTCFAGIQITARGLHVAPILASPAFSPANTVYAGSPVTVSASVVAGTPPIYFQWQTDGGSGGALTNIPGQTASTLNVTPADIGYQYAIQYCCIGSNAFGIGISPTNTLTVNQQSAPILTADMGGTTPGAAAVGYNTNVYGFIGGNVQFHAEFNAGTFPITNQWLLKPDSGGGYAPIVGATGWYWTVTNVLSAKAGLYELAATNVVGSNYSSWAHLTALADPAAPGSTGVTNMYANDVMTNHPWAYWKFEETNDTFFSSMQAYDYSGHNFDATYGNSTDGSMSTGCKDGFETLPDLGPNSLPGNPWAGFPTNNMCAKPSPNHANGYLYLPPLNLYTNAVTFTMWIKPNVATLPKSTGLLMNRNGFDAAGIGFGTTVNAGSTPCLAYTWNNNSSATYGWNSGLFPVAGIWNFVACTITPSNTVMYLYNASSGGTNLYRAVNNVTNAAEAFNGGTTWLASDNWNNGNNFNGWIDEVAIFTNSLGENLIHDLFLKALGLTNGIPPTFYQQPTNTAVFQGQTLQLSALASGIPTPATNSQYQWQHPSGTTWANLATTTGRLTTNATLYWQYFNGSVPSFRAMAFNSSGTNYSLGATVAYVPCPTNEGLWTVNFCVPSTANTGPGTPYVGPGVLAPYNTTAYWNTLSGLNMQNITGLLDDGITPSGIKVSATNGNLYTFCSGVPCNNLLLDQYCQLHDTNNGVNFFFTQVPKGIYNMALYGCTASYANRGVGFTVITNGVSAGTQWVTNNTENAQDLFFTPYDNTVVFTNLLVVNGKLQVNAAIALSTPAYTNGSSTEADFNGAQLQLVTAGPDFWSCYNKGTNVVLTWGGGGLQQSTNLTPGVGLGWVTNTAVSPYTFAPTGAVRFFRIVNGAAHWP